MKGRAQLKSFQKNKKLAITGNKRLGRLGGPKGIKHEKPLMPEKLEIANELLKGVEIPKK